jgi:hypothetical protein
MLWFNSASVSSTLSNFVLSRHHDELRIRHRQLACVSTQRWRSRHDDKPISNAEATVPQAANNKHGILVLANYAIALTSHPEESGGVCFDAPQSLQLEPHVATPLALLILQHASTQVMTLRCTKHDATSSTFLFLLLLGVGVSFLLLLLLVLAGLCWVSLHMPSARSDSRCCTTCRRCGSSCAHCCLASCVSVTCRAIANVNHDGWCAASHPRHAKQDNREVRDNGSAGELHRAQIKPVQACLLLLLVNA